MKNSPIYQAGAIGFIIANGVPKVGQLLSAVWNLDAICRFKILPAGTPLLQSSTSEKREVNNGNTPQTSTASKTSHKETADRIDMPPPPSPASSTCSDTGSATTSHSKKYDQLRIFIKMR